MSDAPLRWGHPLLTPEGLEIRVPNIFEHLKLRGLVYRDRDSGLWRLNAKIDEFMRPEYAPLMECAKYGNLQRVLGPELEGPVWVKCLCRECHRRRGESDRTGLSRNDLAKAARRAAARRNR